jgi:hypothetical protein
MTQRLFATICAVLLGGSLLAAKPAYLDFPEIRASCEKVAHMRIGPSGVTRTQADLLADTYFQIFLGQCGGSGPVQQMRDHWSAPVVVGIAGAHDGALRIDRFTGAVSYHRKPTLLPKDFPSAFFREYSR